DTTVRIWDPSAEGEVFRIVTGGPIDEARLGVSEGEDGRPLTFLAIVSGSHRRATLDLPGSTLGTLA
ncbi:hypothetical protein, partial [Actinoplanes digitatis]